jgi:hypothetical protein
MRTTKTVDRFFVQPLDLIHGQETGAHSSSQFLHQISVSAQHTVRGIIEALVISV